MKEAIEKLEELVKDVVNTVGWELIAAKPPEKFNELVEKISGLKETLEKLKTQAAVFEISKAEREVLDGIYREEPELKEEGIQNFDGYYVHYDKFFKAINQAWPDVRMDYLEDPLELVTKLIDERDEAISTGVPILEVFAHKGKAEAISTMLKSGVKSEREIMEENEEKATADDTDCTDKSEEREKNNLNPAEAQRRREKEDIVEAISKKFRTFGGGNTTLNNPLSHVLKDAPLQFAAGVDVGNVVEAVLKLIKTGSEERQEWQELRLLDPVIKIGIHRKWDSVGPLIGIYVNDKPADFDYYQAAESRDEKEKDYLNHKLRNTNEREEKLEEIVERIMTQHWDMAACRCWVCQAGREAGCRPREEYLLCEHESEKKYGHVTVEKNREEDEKDVLKHEYPGHRGHEYLGYREHEEKENEKRNQ